MVSVEQIDKKIEKLKKRLERLYALRRKLIVKQTLENLESDRLRHKIKKHEKEIEEMMSHVEEDETEETHQRKGKRNSRTKI